MRIVRCMSIVLLMTLLVLAQDSAMPSMPWFDHVKQPTAMSHEELCQLSTNIFNALKEKKNTSQIAALAPDEQLPRVVFITIGSANWPGRTYFGTGLSFRKAVEEAISILLKNEPGFAAETGKNTKAMIADLSKEGKSVPKELSERAANPGEWNWLKMDVVQVAKPSFGFQTGHSRIALTSLVGFAFGPEMGYAFTPDQIVGRSLMNEAGHLAKQQIANVISECYNWNALKIWLKLSAVEQGQRICLFETDSYFTNGKEACRLYRGHRLMDKAPDASEALAMASACAAKTSSNVKGDGTFEAPMSEWETSMSVDESMDTMAEYAIALCRLSRKTGKKEYADMAESALFKNIASLRKYGEKNYVVLEDEKLPEKSMQVAEKVGMLRSNALACLALLELRACGKDIKGGIDNAIRGLAFNLDAYFTSGCEFYRGRYWKNGQPLNDKNLGLFADEEDAALAMLALSRSSDALLLDDLNAKTQEMLGEFMEYKVMKVPMETVNVSPWIAEALASMKRDDKNYVLAMLKIAYAITAASDVSPLYPDYYGAQIRRPGCTLAADRSWSLLAISERLGNIEKPALALEQLKEAEASVMFQVQAFIDEAGASILPSPVKYIGYFRDNLEGCGFTMHGQTAQITSLCLYATQLEKTANYSNQQFYGKLAKARLASDKHPGPLAVELILTQENDVDIEKRKLSGDIEKTQDERVNIKKNDASNGGQSAKRKQKK